MGRHYLHASSDRKPEFSKIILLLVMATYFAGVIIGGIVALRASEELTAFLAFVGAPTTTAIGFYAWKAKAENMKKIGLKEDTDHEME